MIKLTKTEKFTAALATLVAVAYVVRALPVNEPPPPMTQAEQRALFYQLNLSPYPAFGEEDKASAQ